MACQTGAVGEREPILTADEFRRLRCSSARQDYERAAYAPLPDSVALEVIRRFPDMREWVAHSKSVSIEVLRVLATDDDSRVRYTVAMRRKLDLPLFEKLSRDPDEVVRSRVAYNRKCPAEVLTRMEAQDPSEWVRSKVRERLGIFRPQVNP